MALPQMSAMTFCAPPQMALPTSKTTTATISDHSARYGRVSAGK